MADQQNTQPNIQEGDLLAYLEGVAAPEVAQRITQSPELLAEANALRATDVTLHGALFRDSCPEMDDLLLYQAGLLPQPEQRHLKRHLKTCEACQQELAQLAIPDLAPAPPSLPERLVESGKRMLTALLQPRAPQPALALRGESQRHYEYQAGDYQIILALVPPVAGENIWQIEGQISGVDDPALLEHATVQIMRDGAAMAHDAVDEFGFFVLEQLAPGTYTLQIDLAADVIIIENVVIA